MRIEFEKLAGINPPDSVPWPDGRKDKIATYRLVPQQDEPRITIKDGVISRLNKPGEAP